MLNLTCPATMGGGDTPPTCGADADVLDVHIESGEFTAFCAYHARDMAGGTGYVTISAAGPLHSTSLFTR